MSSQTTYTTWDSSSFVPIQPMWVDEAVGIDQNVFARVETAQLRPCTEYKMSYEEFLKGMFFTVKKPVGRNPL